MKIRKNGGHKERKEEKVLEGMLIMNEEVLKFGSVPLVEPLPK
jgi:hypothetical protein